MLKIFFPGLMALAVATTSASAGLLWKDQLRYDQLKNERLVTLKKDLKTPIVAAPEVQKKKIIVRNIKPNFSHSDYVENSNDIMKETQKVKRARKIIGAIKSMSPNLFKQIFQMKKPEFSKDNQDI